MDKNDEAGLKVLEGFSHDLARDLLTKLLDKAMELNMSAAGTSMAVIEMVSKMYSTTVIAAVAGDPDRVPGLLKKVNFLVESQIKHVMKDLKSTMDTTT